MVGFKNDRVRGFIQGKGNLGQLSALRNMEESQLVGIQLR